MNIRQQIFRQLLAGTLATSLCGASSGIASAEGSDSAAPKSMVVRFGDLNLSSQAGVEELYGRIRRAADIVCNETRPSTTTPFSPAAQKCKAEVVSATVGKINNKVLTAMHQQKTSRRYG